MHEIDADLLHELLESVDVDYTQPVDLIGEFELKQRLLASATDEHTIDTVEREFEKPVGDIPYERNVDNYDIPYGCTRREMVTLVRHATITLEDDVVPFSEYMSYIKTGRRHSKETKEKMSQKKKGKPMSEEHKEKIRRAVTGRKMSEETKRKMSESHIKRWKKRGARTV